MWSETAIIEGAPPVPGWGHRVGNFSEQNWGDSPERRQHPPLRVRHDHPQDAGHRRRRPASAPRPRHHDRGHLTPPRRGHHRTRSDPLDLTARGRSADHGQGDELSASKVIYCPATGKSHCPLTPGENRGQPGAFHPHLRSHDGCPTVLFPNSPHEPSALRRLPPGGHTHHDDRGHRHRTFGNRTNYSPETAEIQWSNNCVRTNHRRGPTKHTEEEWTHWKVQRVSMDNPRVEPKRD
ncbi:hypothetical protein [Ornithinimicrobium kibberense]|uniref:hypothetical protein n=1 Tax=Ornithinimicrobium kibberense TaxID=282060 RepID=UPI0036153ADB